MGWLWWWRMGGRGGGAVSSVYAASDAVCMDFLCVCVLVNACDDHLSAKVRVQEAAAGVPLPQVNLLRLLQLSLGCELRRCSPSQLGLEMPENWHHVFTKSIDGSRRNNRYCVRLCGKHESRVPTCDLGSYADLESALLVNDGFQLMRGNVCNLHVLKTLDVKWLGLLQVKRFVRKGVYNVEPLTEIITALARPPSQVSDEDVFGEDEHPRHTQAKRKHAATTGGRTELVSVPTSGATVRDVAHMYARQLVSLERDFVSVIFDGFDEVRTLSLSIMMDKLMACTRNEHVDEVPFPKRPSRRNDRCLALYLRSAKAVVARQVIGTLADISNEEVHQISHEINQQLLVPHFKTLLQCELSELKGTLQRHPETQLNTFHLLLVAVWTDMWDHAYFIRQSYSQFPDCLSADGPGSEAAIVESILVTCARRVKVLEWGGENLLDESSAQEKRKFWPVYCIAMMALTDSVITALIADLTCGLDYFRSALESHQRFRACSISINPDSSYLRVIVAEIRARLLIMLPRGFIEDHLVHAEVYSLVKLRYEAYGNLLRTDDEITSGNRLPEMELQAVVNFLHYIVHFGASDEPVQPRVFVDFPEFNKQHILRRALRVVQINASHCVTYRAGFFTTYPIVIMFDLLKLLDHPHCIAGSDPILIASIRSAALTILDVNSRTDPRAGAFASMYLNQPATRVPFERNRQDSAISGFRQKVNALLQPEGSNLLNEALQDPFFERSFDLVQAT